MARWRRPCRGQALVAGLVLLSLLLIAWLGAYQIARLLHQKSRLSAVADAAAYSAAVVQSRLLNQLAYANRAALAHQMAMAHWITLASQARFGDAQSRQLIKRNPPASLIGGFFGPRHGAAYLASRAAAGATQAAEWEQGALARAFAEHDAWLREQFTAVQQSWLRLLPVRRQHVLEEIVARGRGEFNLGADLLRDALPDRLRAPGETDEHRFLRWVERAQLQFGFLNPRDETARSLLPTEWRCPWRRHELRRRGQTQRDGLDGWTVHDSASFHALRSNRWIGCYYREYPMGGSAIAHAPAAGQAHHDDAPEDFAAVDFWRWVERYAQWDLLTGQDNPLANSWARRRQISWRGGAIAPYADVQVEQPEDTIAFSIEVKAAPLRSRLTRWGENRPMSVVVSAESHYLRWQERSDGRIELPSLFQPFWHARLVPNPDQEDDDVAR